MASEPYQDKAVSGLDKEEKLARFKEWLKLSADSESKQREREKEDLEFQVGENQWPSEAKKERQGRPMLSISLVAQPLQLVQNQASNAHLGVTISAVSENADEELAEIKQGLYQRIQRDGLANQARLWALNRASQCGRGWYRINTQYDEDSENLSDQEIVFERILYQEMVYPDPAATKPDFSDGRFCFVAAYVPCEVFKERYPQAEKYSTQDFADLQSASPEWVKGDGNSRDPMVAECFYRVVTMEDVGIEGTDFRRKREVVTVHRAVLSGCEILEDDEWIGKYIPLVPVIGRELQPFDGERRWEGMVRPARDGQMTYNYAISSLVEDVSRLSKAPVVGAEGQFEGHEKEWLESNRRNLPYLQYKPTTFGGQPVPPPQTMQIDGTKMQLSLQLSQEAKGFVQVATAVYEPSLGEVQGGAKGQSGKAIQALQQQADAGTGNYLGNLAGMSMPYEAKIVLDLIGHVYDRPGRVTQVLGGEDETKAVMLNQPFVQDPRTGRPMPVKEGTPGAKMYDLAGAKGRYAVAVSVGKSFQTRLQEGAEEMGQILQALPPEMQVVLLPTYMRFKDTPGAKETADLLTKFRDMKFPGLADKEGEQPTLEQVKAQNQALQQQVQQMQQQLQEAAEAIKTDQAKQQATLQKAQMDAQTGLQKSQMDMQAAMQKAQLEASVKQQLAEFEAAHAVALENDRQKAAMELEALKLEFERWKVEFEAAHDVGMAAAAGRTATLTRDRGQDHGSEESNEQGSSAEPFRDLG